MPLFYNIAANSAYYRYLSSTVTPSQSGIITDNLIFWVDASKTGSYNGSGNTWYDLSGKGNNMTLSNCQFTGGNSFWFNGSNSYVVSSNSLYNNFFTGAYNQTQEVWLLNTTSTGSFTNGVIIEEYGTNNLASPNWYYTYGEIQTNNTVKIGVWNGTLVNTTLSQSFTGGDWTHLTWRYNASSGTLDGFVNGVKRGTTNAVRVRPITGSYYPAMGNSNLTNMGNGVNYKGYMGVYRSYASSLSDSDILNNYNYEKNNYLNGTTIYGTLAGPNFAPYNSTNTQSPTNAPCWQLFYATSAFSFTGVSQYVNTNGSNNWNWYYMVAPSANSTNFAGATVVNIGSDSRSYVANNYYTATVTQTSVPAGYYFMVGCVVGPYYKVFNSASKDYIFSIGGSVKYVMKNTCYWRTHGGSSTMDIPTQVGGSGVYNNPSSTIWCMGLAGIN